VNNISKNKELVFSLLVGGCIFSSLYSMATQENSLFREQEQNLRTAKNELKKTCEDTFNKKQIIVDKITNIESNLVKDIAATSHSLLEKTETYEKAINNDAQTTTWWSHVSGKKQRQLGLTLDKIEKKVSLTEDEQQSYNALVGKAMKQTLATNIRCSNSINKSGERLPALTTLSKMLIIDSTPRVDLINKALNNDDETAKFELAKDIFKRMDRFGNITLEF